MGIKVAFAQLASCWGCHQSILDLHFDLLEILPLLDIVYWQAVVDTKHAELEAMPDGSITVGFIEGHVRTDHDEHMLKVMRKKCAVLIAMGACATHGGIAGMANMYSLDDNTKRKFITADSVVDNYAIPSENLPAFTNKVTPNDEIVKFDAMLYGCPPTSDNIKGAILSLIPILLDTKYLDTNVCETCEIRGTDCYLRRGVACVGSITGAPLGLKWNESKGPVKGEYGPTNNIAQPEANYLLDLAAGVTTVTDEIAKLIIEFITLYFRLPAMGQVYLSADVLQAAAQRAVLPTKMVGSSIAVDLNAITAEMVGPALAPVFTGLPQVIKDIVGVSLGHLTKFEKFKPGLQTVCDHCDRNNGNIKLLGYKRDYEGIKNPEKCLLNQGYICLGFLTNAGCGARCPNVNAPCIGCYGPSLDIVGNPDAFVSKIQAVLGHGTVEDLINKMEDPVGVFYKSNYPKTKKSLIIEKRV